MAKLEKFGAKTVEGKAIRDIKSRQNKIDKAGMTLVSLWYEQGKELIELQAILGCSERALEGHTGIKRSTFKTYIAIAQDPRLGEEGVTKQLGNFTQKDLIKLTKLDEEEFNEAVDAGELPKAKAASDEEPTEKKEVPSWKDELHDIIEGAKTIEEAETALLAHFGKMSATDVEVEAEEVEMTPEEKLRTALGRIDSEDLGEQAVALGLKKNTLKNAIEEGVMSKATVKKIDTFLAA